MAKHTIWNKFSELWVRKLTGKPGGRTPRNASSKLAASIRFMQLVYSFWRLKAGLGEPIRICCAETWRLQPVAPYPPQETSEH